LFSNPRLFQVFTLKKFLSEDILSLIALAEPVGKAILLILLFFSIISLAIIIEKSRAIKKARIKSREFLKIFRRSGKFSEVNSACGKRKESPLVGLFLAGFNELNYQLKTGYQAQAALGNPESRVTIRSMDAIARALQRAASLEINKLERGLNFLATTASVAPFFGLFGTVWGIVTAFHQIGVQGSASLSAIAPGIAAALITTAFGLVVAIPAVIGYNHILNKIKTLSSEMDDFILEFITIAERNFT
jgi:biopolymer transport protein TolQ